MYASMFAIWISHGERNRQKGVAEAIARVEMIKVESNILGIRKGNATLRMGEKGG
jgi:hypothetical protein